MEIDEQCLEWVPYMPGTTVKEYPVLSRNAPLGTGTYYMPKWNRMSPLPQEQAQGLMTHPEGRASTPHGNTWWPPSES